METSGDSLYALVKQLYPICRSITGDGVRETLSHLAGHIPLQVHEVPSGTKVLDWEIPLEWNIRDAWIKDPAGRKVVDFAESNLHVLNYSEPVRRTLPLGELRERIFTLPEHPDWIPYRTSYHNRTWGFCMAHNRYRQLEEGDYEVMIDSSLEPGSLTYAEFFKPGATRNEVLLTTHICHPSLCNDNLSGTVVAAALGSLLMEMETRYSYRILFSPGTLGPIAWLARNGEHLGNIRHGLVLNLLGDVSGFHYKLSRDGDAEIDRIVPRVLRAMGKPCERIAFYPYGYDERQFCSPGFNLPVGRLSRKPHGQFPEYHTSADNPGFIKPERLEESLEVLRGIIGEIEQSRLYLNLSPMGEPQLGKRGLFKKVGGADTKDYQMALLWMLNLSDGKHSIESIAERSGLPLESLEKAADALAGAGLLDQLS